MTGYHTFTEAEVTALATEASKIAMQCYHRDGLTQQESIRAAMFTVLTDNRGDPADAPIDAELRTLAEQVAELERLAGSR